MQSVLTIRLLSAAMLQQQLDPSADLDPLLLAPYLATRYNLTYVMPPLSGELAQLSRVLGLSLGELTLREVTSQHGAFDANRTFIANEKELSEAFWERRKQAGGVPACHSNGNLWVEHKLEQVQQAAEPSVKAAPPRPMLLDMRSGHLQPNQLLRHLPLMGVLRRKYCAAAHERGMLAAALAADRSSDRIVVAVMLTPTSDSVFRQTAISLVLDRLHALDPLGNISVQLFSVEGPNDRRGAVCRCSSLPHTRQFERKWSAVERDKSEGAATQQRQ